ncbi:hypothetical protein SGFS_013330 [Streptomyces graminofaciens]|uniref:Uncharacterized protein n=2 Tax=Streptomyces graminofaciens TaxID=68212 RepID=A0ABN5VAK7_9ACTN|nr:hypothetical protein SGFS_013330 [Streptomyces graminofaciens]
MPDLHTWITQQIANAERVARQAREDIAALLASGEINSRIAERHIALSDPANVLRRCTADRKILAEHQPFGSQWEPYACVGCGLGAGDCGDWVTEHTNDCPTLLALAEGYGLTEQQRAGLDRPAPDPPAHKPHGPAPDTSRVPAALRGPNWRPNR